jgi:hypothetical protein
MSRLPLVLVIWIAAAACGGGDDDEVVVDGAVAPDSSGDGASIDCRGEADDDRNGDSAESTGLTFAGARIAQCGAIDLGHAQGDLIDRDRYQLTVAPAAPVVVRLTAPLAGAVERLELRVDDAGGNPRSVARVRAGHAVTTLLLPQGEYHLTVEARAASAAIAIPYRIEIFADQPAMRCPPMPDGTTHIEVDESASGHRTNDVVEARGAPPILTTQATPDADDPDATGQAATAGGRFTIAGTSASITSDGDAYHDRDTFAFYTGASTNQLDVRVVWTGGLADLDVLVFEAGKPDDPMGTPTAALIGEEIVVTSVEPSRPYWLWVGGSGRSTSLPTAYEVHVCGREIAAAPAE